MQRHECIEILQQLKLTAMIESFDEIVTDGIRRKRSTMDILGRLLTTEQTCRHSLRQIGNDSFCYVLLFQTSYMYEMLLK